MHSSRMRTGRSLTVCWSLLRGGVCSREGGWVSAPGGCLLLGGVSDPREVSAPGGVCSQGGVYSRGVSALGGVCSGGVCSKGCLLQGVSALGGCLLLGLYALGGCLLLGGLVSQYALRQTPPL